MLINQLTYTPFGSFMTNIDTKLVNIYTFKIRMMSVKLVKSQLTSLDTSKFTRVDNSHAKCLKQ